MCSTRRVNVFSCVKRIMFMTQTSTIAVGQFYRSIELFEVLTVKNRFCHKHRTGSSSFASAVKAVDYKLPVRSEHNDG